jgi:hypothetical protein
MFRPSPSRESGKLTRVVSARPARVKRLSLVHGRNGACAISWQMPTTASIGCGLRQHLIDEHASGLAAVRPEDLADAAVAEARQSEAKSGPKRRKIHRQFCLICRRFVFRLQNFDLH